MSLVYGVGRAEDLLGRLNGFEEEERGRVSCAAGQRGHPVVAVLLVEALFAHGRQLTTLGDEAQNKVSEYLYSLGHRKQGKRSSYKQYPER